MGDIPLAGPDGIKRLLIKQRHLHKNGIMFTDFVFAIVVVSITPIFFFFLLFFLLLTALLRIILTQKQTADTIINEDSLEGAINAIAGDPEAGGCSSSGLIDHNAEDSVVTKLASCIYWCELYLNRSMPASAAASDCQSGPSAAFRLAAIGPILIRWYNQKIFGNRTVSKISGALAASCGPLEQQKLTSSSSLRNTDCQRRSPSDIASSTQRMERS